MLRLNQHFLKLIIVKILNSNDYPLEGQQYRPSGQQTADFYGQQP